MTTARYQHPPDEPVRCPQCASEDVVPRDEDKRGEAWACKDCHCYWGFRDGPSSYEFMHTGEEVRALMDYMKKEDTDAEE